jgi:hypothetical protein
MTTVVRASRKLVRMAASTTHERLALLERQERDLADLWHRLHEQLERGPSSDVLDAQARSVSTARQLLRRRIELLRG